VCGILAGVAAEPKRPPAHVSGAGGPRAAHANLVTINAGTPAKPPLFCVHAEAGDVSLYHAMAGHLSDDQPVLGLCAPAVGELAGEPRIERLAELHVQAIRAARSEGPYLIVGECTGGALAYEIAQQLRAAGETVALLALVDAFAPGLPRLRRTMPRLLYRMLHRARILGFHFHNLVRLGVGEKLAYAATKARRAQLALTTKASRRLHRASAGESPQLAFREALAAYTPTSAGGPMVLFRAARLPLGIEPSPDLGWGALVESLQVETVPGYFTTPISEPGVQVLADRLAGHLARITSAP
jgi:thioesterase domain-containing protein